jgi:nucleoside-diphosphate-sugar epimerase
MSSSQSKRIIVVVGATGIQGSGVVRALLSDEYGDSWFVRALTQDPSSNKAQKLLSEYQTSDNRLSLVAGHVYDETSLKSAFVGAYGVFALTSERYPGKSLTEEWELKHEIDAGLNIISAAKECCIQHLVYSSLPDTVKASGGQFKRIHHMNNKHTIEQLARKELDGFTALIPGEYFVVGFCRHPEPLLIADVFVLSRFLLHQLGLVAVLPPSWFVPSSIQMTYRH